MKIGKYQFDILNTSQAFIELNMWCLSKNCKWHYRALTFSIYGAKEGKVVCKKHITIPYMVKYNKKWKEDFKRISSYNLDGGGFDL